MAQRRRERATGPARRVPKQPVYKTHCDYHPNRRAKYAFTEARTGKKRGLCGACFDDERRRSKPKRRAAR